MRRPSAAGRDAIDEDAVFASGSALAAIAGMIEEKDVCTAAEIS
jgi:hypothetical protein